MNELERGVAMQIQNQDAENPGGKYLTFQLDGTDFGIPILRVIELLKVMEITTVPTWPAYAKGTINLRGAVIPVVDLRLKFGLDEVEATEHTCIIVVELMSEQIGVIVEAVNEVLDIKEDSIAPSPRIGGTVNSDFIIGMGKSEERTTILLDLAKVLSDAGEVILEGIPEMVTS
jgi:purine-binding chemotaxis protein CheW